MNRLLAVAVVTLTACAPSVQIDGAVAFGAGCELDAKLAKARGLLDIGNDPDTANEYDLGMLASSDADDVTYDGVSVFFSTDEDTDTNKKLTLDGMPVDAASAHHLTIGATSKIATVTAPIVSKADAGLLQGADFVATQINAGGFANIAVHITLLGRTASGVRVASQDFPFRLDLCQGCLTGTPTCIDNTTIPPVAVDPVSNPALCGVGDDVPLFVCP